AAVAFWLVLPFVFLSSFSAHSRWVVFRATTLRQMLHKLPAVLAFYFLAAFVVGAALAATGVFVMRPMFVWIPVFAIACATAILVHARLLGRLGGQIVRVQLKQAPPPPRKRKRRRPTPENPDAWDIPVAKRNRKLREAKPVIHLPFDGAVEPYLLTENAAPAAVPQPRPKPFEEPGDPYEMVAETEPPKKVEPPLDGWLPIGVEPPPRLPGEPKQPISPDELEMQILLNRQQKPINFSLVRGVFSFPWYPTTRVPWLRLCFGFAVMGLFVVFMASLFPRG